MEINTKQSLRVSGEEFDSNACNREMQILALFGRSLRLIKERYPTTKNLVEDIQAQVIASVIDW